jgi:hypothetical protein
MHTNMAQITYYIFQPVLCYNRVCQYPTHVNSMMYYFDEL